MSKKHAVMFAMLLFGSLLYPISDGLSFMVVGSSSMGPVAAYNASRQFSRDCSQMEIPVLERVVSVMSNNTDSFRIAGLGRSSVVYYRPYPFAAGGQSASLYYIRPEGAACAYWVKNEPVVGQQHPQYVGIEYMPQSRDKGKINFYPSASLTTTAITVSERSAGNMQDGFYFVAEGRSTDPMPGLHFESPNGAASNQLYYQENGGINPFAGYVNAPFTSRKGSVFEGLSQFGASFSMLFQ